MWVFPANQREMERSQTWLELHRYPDSSATSPLAPHTKGISIVLNLLIPTAGPNSLFPTAMAEGGDSRFILHGLILLLWKQKCKQPAKGAFRRRWGFDFSYQALLSSSSHRVSVSLLQPPSLPSSPCHRLPAKEPAQQWETTETRRETGKQGIQWHQRLLKPCQQGWSICCFLDYKLSQYLKSRVHVFSFNHLESTLFSLLSSSGKSSLLIFQFASLLSRDIPSFFQALGSGFSATSSQLQKDPSSPVSHRQQSLEPQELHPGQPLSPQKW